MPSVSKAFLVFASTHIYSLALNYLQLYIYIYIDACTRTNCHGMEFFTAPHETQIEGQGSMALAAVWCIIIRHSLWFDLFSSLRLKTRPNFCETTMKERMDTPETNNTVRT